MYSSVQKPKPDSLINHHEHQLIFQGDAISNEMKNDIIDTYYKVADESEFKFRAASIQRELEIKYGKIWSIVVAPLREQLSFAFVYDEDLLLEFTTANHRILAYLIPKPRPIEYRQILTPPVVYESPVRVRYPSPIRYNRDYQQSYYPSRLAGSTYFRSYPRQYYY